MHHVGLHYASVSRGTVDRMTKKNSLYNWLTLNASQVRRNYGMCDIWKVRSSSLSYRPWLYCLVHCEVCRLQQVPFHYCLFFIYSHIILKWKTASVDNVFWIIIILEYFPFKLRQMFWYTVLYTLLCEEVHTNICNTFWCFTHSNRVNVNKQILPAAPLVSVQYNG